MKVQCCKCKRMKLNGRWVFAKHHIHESISHGYCPKCADATKLEFFSERASQTTFHRAGQLQELLQQIMA